MLYKNISGYKFIELNNLDLLKNSLQESCLCFDLKGTILLSTEGINLFLCGSPENINAFQESLFKTPVGELSFRASASNTIPFKHLRIKIKPEIITSGMQDISPGKNPAPTLLAADFKKMLDENLDSEAFVVLDTRNAYEVKMGKFKNAIDLNINNFVEFKEAIKQLPDTLKNKPIVTYCTGGIRCEKAAPWLIQAGFKKVYQLQGGILGYLENGQHDLDQGSHFEGECFVFDNRIALNTKDFLKV